MAVRILATIVLLSGVFSKASFVLENGQTNVALDTQLDAGMASEKEEILTI